MFIKKNIQKSTLSYLRRAVWLIKLDMENLSNRNEINVKMFLTTYIENVKHVAVLIFWYYILNAVI